MKKYAFLIGNSQFPDEPDQKKLPTLACPERDVDDLAVVLADVNRGEFEVLTLKNQASHLVLRKLQQTIKLLQADDLLLVYYSGHGKPNKNNILHLTTFDTVISELESTAIPIHRVYEIIATGKAKKIIIILDCCYSSAAGQGFRGDINDGLQQLNNSRGTYLVTASTELQVAHENTTDGYGLFTKHLIAGLTTGAADKDGDGFISMNELYDYVHDNVIAENPNQQPTRHVKDERGGLTIAKSGRDSRKDRSEKIRQLLLEFEKQHEDITEIKTEALAIARTDMAKLSPVQLEKDQLLSDLRNKKISLFSFVRSWDRLATEPTTEKPAKPKIIDTPVNIVEKPAKPKTTDIPVNTVENSPKRKNLLTISSMAVVFSLMGIGGWQFISINNITAEPTEKAGTPIANAPATPTLKAVIIEPEMVAIKGGCFSMGSPASEKDRRSDEKQHEVCVDAFSLGKTEVTKGQFSAFVSVTHYQTEAETGDGCNMLTGTDWKKDKKYNWRNVGFTQTDEHPVVCVSWNDAMAYITWLNKETGKSYRLPTEAEWEYAARAGTTTPFYTGECLSSTQANYNGNTPYNSCAKGDYKQHTVTVGSYPANDWGLSDMAGNVWEWTCSAYVANYDGSEKKCVSKNDANSFRVLRGGSWYNSARLARSAHRGSSTPDIRFSLIGFRFALGQTAS